MKKFLPFLIVISVMAFLIVSCNEESSVTYDTVPYQQVTPTYPEGDNVNVGGGTDTGSTGGTDGGTTGGSTGGGDTGGSTGTDPDFDPTVMLKVISGKYCTWSAASENSLCIRTEADIEDPNAKTICWGSPANGIPVVPRFEKNDSRYGSTSAVGLTDISSIFSQRPQQMDGNYWHMTAALKGGKGDAWGTDATVNDAVGSMSGHLSGRQGSPLQTIDNLTIMKTVAGLKHTHFLLSDGSLTGIGTGTSGQLGLENRYRVLNKVTYFAPDSEAGQKWTDVRDVAAGSYHTAIIRGEKNQAGTVWVIGKNDDGQHGNTDYTSIAEWQETSITDAVQVAAGSNATCVLHVNGDVSCAGPGRNAIIANGPDAHLDANGNDTLRHPFTKITHIMDEGGNLEPIPPMKFITMGTAVAYAIDHRSNLYAWGSNGQGHAGVNRPDLQYITRPMFTGLQNVTDVAVHNTTAVARVGSGTSATWYVVGNNSVGQVYGDPTKATTEPVHQWQKLDLSNVVTPDPNAVDPATEVVAAPTNLSSSQTTDNSTRVSWQGDVDKHDYFNMSICADPAGGCVLDDTYGYVQSGDWRYVVRTLRQTEIGISGVQPGSTVRVRLQAVSFLGNVSPWTDELTVAIPTQ